jgi:hypothetical protein
MQDSVLHRVTFCTRRKSPMAQATFSCRFAAIHLEKRMRGGFRFPPLMTLPLKATQEGRPRPSWITPEGRKARDGNEGCTALAPMQSKFASLSNHTIQRAERENDAITMRLRATRTAATINGQDFRHGRESTGNAVSGFLFGDFFKSEKATRCRTESCILRPPQDGKRGTIGRRAARPAPGNFPLVRKVTKGTAGVPPALPPLSFGGDAFAGRIAYRAYSKCVCVYFRASRSRKAVL